MKAILLLLGTLPSILHAQYSVLSVAGVAPNQTIVTRYDKGYVVTNAGEQLEGTIQLKVKKSDTVEVRLKGDGGKKVFARNQIKSFGLLKTIEDYREVKNPRKNFHPGYILTTTGKKMEGKIAMRALDENEINNFFLSAALFERGDKYVSIIPASAIQTVVQQVEGKEVTYENYKGGLLAHILEGRIIIMRNPFPTTEREGLNNLVNQVADSAAKKMAEKTVERNLGEAMAGNEKAEERMNEDLENAATLSQTDSHLMQNEYLIKTKGSDELTIIKPDNFNQWSNRLASTCAALSGEKNLMKYNKIYDLVRFYNSNCEN